jgi:antitoxin component of RelBE/YafQ-DinJ toxin-antitoxin module
MEWKGYAQLSFKVDARLKDRFKHECNRRGITMARAFDIIITRWVGKKQREVNPQKYHKYFYKDK